MSPRAEVNVVVRTVDYEGSDIVGIAATKLGAKKILIREVKKENIYGRGKFMFSNDKDAAHYSDISFEILTYEVEP